MMDFQNFGGLSWLPSIISSTWCVIHYYVVKRALSEGSFSTDSILLDLMLKKIVFLKCLFYFLSSHKMILFLLQVDEGPYWLMGCLKEWFSHDFSPKVFLLPQKESIYHRFWTALTPWLMKLISLVKNFFTYPTKTKQLLHHWEVFPSIFRVKGFHRSDLKQASGKPTRTRCA